jgi:hypothetical protein
VKRFALVLGLTVVLAGAVIAAASALSFDDSSSFACTTPDDVTWTCPQGTLGTSYSVQLKVREGGGCPPYGFRALSGALPPGLTVSGSYITGTPTTQGVYSFYLEAYDSPVSGQCNLNCGPPGTLCTDFQKSTQKQFFITINSGLQIVTNDVPQNASVGVPYSATLQAQVLTSLNPPAGTPATGAIWSVISGVGTGLPPGLNLGDGVISGTPTTEGAYTFRIQASLNGASHFQTYSLNVRKPLVVTPAKPLATPSLPTAWETGLPFLAKLTPSGGSGTYTITLASGALPTGLTLGPEGVFRATVHVADSEGRTLDYAANFGVAAKLAVRTVALKPGKVARLYRSRLVSTGGVPVKKWKVLTGPLPKGIRLDRTLGVLSGTPTKPGSYRVTFQVTDGLKVVAKKTLRIVVAK